MWPDKSSDSAAVRLWIWFRNSNFRKTYSLGTNTVIGRCEKAPYRKWINASNGSPCSYCQSFLRNIFQVFGFFDWLFVFGKKRQRLGDIAAGTIVVQKISYLKMATEEPSCWRLLCDRYNLAFRWSINITCISVEYSNCNLLQSECIRDQIISLLSWNSLLFRYPWRPLIWQADWE
jgi:hypothetical protein